MLDKMNVFYIGVDNPVTISSGTGWDKTTVNPTGCTISGTGSNRTVKVSAALLKCHFSSHFCCIYFFRDIFSSCNFINNLSYIVQRNRLSIAMLWILYLKWLKHRILYLFEWYEIIKLVYIFFFFFFCGQSDNQNYLSQFIGGSALFLMRFTSWWWKT